MGFWDEEVELLEEVVEVTAELKAIVDKLEASPYHKGLDSDEVEALVNAIKPFKEIKW